MYLGAAALVGWTVGHPEDLGPSAASFTVSWIVSVSLYLAWRAYNRSTNTT